MYEIHYDNVSPTETLEDYIGEYSATAKAYRTQSGPDVFFREVAKFLLEITCIHHKTYGMPKNIASLIIMTYQGNIVD